MGKYLISIIQSYILPLHSICYYTRRDAVDYYFTLYEWQSIRRYGKMKFINFFSKKESAKEKKMKKAKRESFYESLANAYFVNVINGN